MIWNVTTQSSAEDGAVFGTEEREVETFTPSERDAFLADRLFNKLFVHRSHNGSWKYKTNPTDKLFESVPPYTTERVLTLDVFEAMMQFGHTSVHGDERGSFAVVWSPQIDGEEITAKGLGVTAGKALFAAIIHAIRLGWEHPYSKSTNSVSDRPEGVVATAD